MIRTVEPSAGPNSSAASASAQPVAQRLIRVRVLRQDAPGQESYWERHAVPYELNMNVISILQRIAANAKSQDGRPVAPVAWDCNCLEEVCGSCTMLVNGRTRMACTALVDKLMEDNPEEIELRPMSKFPVVRDLVVDRRRLFRSLERVEAWMPIDGSYDQGAGPRISPESQEDAYPLSTCISCGCCLEACPQFTKIELVRHENETVADFEKRRRSAFDRGFIGAHAISQAMLFNSHPTGQLIADQRLQAITAQGGIQMCGNAQNCVAVCPKSIPLTRSIARAGRAATVWAIKKLFDR
ncbi:MAG: succinate dehydrogenase iron-sulfur subunit [Planctomycetaceae bacterium]|nr:MAG: succinate dehydrogenase iron-sulfur subunit [Planctomycetaceae bacterium]PHY03357.1 MAG: succinate dehydrogenase iron-sulfur subunit [Planctomycetaceae bacterium]